VDDSGELLFPRVRASAQVIIVIVIIIIIIIALYRKPKSDFSPLPPPPPLRRTLALYAGIRNGRSNLKRFIAKSNFALWIA